MPGDVETDTSLEADGVLVNELQQQVRRLCGHLCHVVMALMKPTTLNSYTLE